MSEERQIILTAWTAGGILDNVYESPISLSGKKIYLKSVHYPKFTTYDKKYYNFTVEDDEGQLYTLYLPPKRYETSTELMIAIHKAMLSLHQELNLEATFAVPQLNHDYANDSVVLDYKDTGLRIAHSFFQTSRIYNVLTYFTSKKVNYELDQYTVKNHDLQYEFDENHVPVYFCCNIVSPSFVNGKKKHVLEVLNMNIDQDMNTIEILNPTLHGIRHDEVFYITCYFEPVEEYELKFSNLYPIIVVLGIK